MTLSPGPSGPPPSVAGLLERAGRLRGWLTGLLWTSGVLGVLVGLGGLGVVLAALSGTSTDEGGGLVGLALVLVVAVSLLLYGLSIRAARRAVGSVAASAGAKVPATLGQEVRRLNTWLTVWQWGALVSAVLSLGLNVLGALAFPEGPGEAGLPVGVVVVAGFIGGLPTVILTWLALGAVKRFFSRVELRARGARQPVGPAAERASNWLMLTYVVLWLAVALSAVGLLVVLLGLVLAGAGSRAGDTPNVVAAALIALASVAVTGWMYSLLLRLVGHSRLFALEAAALLDQPGAPGRTTEPVPPANPWQGFPGGHPG